MFKKIKKSFLPLYKTSDNKIVNYGWHSSPPFISKGEKTFIEKNNLSKKIPEKPVKYFEEEIKYQ